MPTAKDSMAYIEAMKGRKAQSKAQKTAAFNQIKMNSGDQVVAMNKIGQGFIGPVMMRLKYEGIARNVLTEDVIAPGAVPVYDVADEMGKAYFLEGYQAEAIISQYEGKRVMYSFRHLAEFATVQEQDFLELTIDMADYAINEARQRIQEKEDGYLFAMLDVAIEGITPTTPDWAGLTSHEVEVTGAFQPANFYQGAAIAAENRLDSVNIIMNPADYFDMLNWDLVATSVNFKDQTFSGVPVTTFAGFNVFRSVICPKGTAYMMPDTDYVGRMPVRKSIEVRDNPKLENFSLGWILDEYINMLILNSGGLVRIKKVENGETGETA